MKNFFMCLGGLAVLSACKPTFKVEAHEKTIEINLKVNIDHLLKVDIVRVVQKAIKNNKDIF